jgi:hypothetical protein
VWVNVNIDSEFEELYFIDRCQRHSIERGLLPVYIYRGRRKKRGLILLQVETAQLCGVPWVLLVCSCLGVA